MDELDALLNGSLSTNDVSNAFKCNACALSFPELNELHGHLRLEHVQQPVVMLDRCQVPLSSPPSLKLTIKSTKENGFQIVPSGDTTEADATSEVAEHATNDEIADTFEKLFFECSESGAGEAKPQSSTPRDDCDSDTSLNLQLDDDEAESEALLTSTVDSQAEAVAEDSNMSLETRNEVEQLVIPGGEPTPPPEVIEMPKIRVKNDLLHKRAVKNETEEIRTSGVLQNDILTNLFANNDRAKDLGFTTVDPDFQPNEMAQSHSSQRAQQQSPGNSMVPPLSNLGSIQQLTHQVTRMQASAAQSGVQQQNVLINIQQFQQPPGMPAPQQVPPGYAQHAMFPTPPRPLVYPTSQGQPVLGVQAQMYPTNPGHPPVGYYQRPYGQPPMIEYRNALYHSQPPQYGPRVPAPPPPQQQQHRPQHTQPNNQTMSHADTSQGLMKPPPPLYHPQANHRPRMRASNPQTLCVTPQRINAPRTRMPSRGGGSRGGSIRMSNPRMMPPPPPAARLGPGPGSHPVRASMSMKRPTDNGINHMPSLAKRPLINSTLVPGKNDDADCQVIAVTQKNAGLQIQSVQGNVPESNGEIHLNGAITITSRQPLEKVESKDSNAVNAKTNEVASVLASRGITITSTGRGRETLESPHQNDDLPIQINLNNSVSIIPKKMDTGRNTVDLTDEIDEKHYTPSPANTNRDSKDQFECHLCPAKFETSAGRAKHRTSFHRTSHAPEFGVPIVDLRQQGVAQRLKDYGIYHYIPLPNESLSGLFALPVITTGCVTDATRAPDFASKILPLGPIRQLVGAARTPTARNNNKN